MQVEYDDGDSELLHLAAEHVRLQLVPGEQLQPQPPAQLQATAAHLLDEAARLEARAAPRAQAAAGGGAAGRGSAKPAQSRSAAHQAEEEEEEQKEMQGKGAWGRGNPTRVLGRPGQGWASLSCGSEVQLQLHP